MVETHLNCHFLYFRFLARLARRVLPGPESAQRSQDLIHLASVRFDSLKLLDPVDVVTGHSKRVTKNENVFYITLAPSTNWLSEDEAALGPVFLGKIDAATDGNVSIVEITPTVRFFFNAFILWNKEAVVHYT
jgi:hypothetical protein